MTLIAQLTTAGDFNVDALLIELDLLFTLPSGLRTKKMTTSPLSEGSSFCALS